MGLVLAISIRSSTCRSGAPASVGRATTFCCLSDVRLPDPIGVSEGHLSHLLAGRRTLTPDIADRIAAAIAEAAL